jgi:colicin import membrane protein
VQIGGVRSPALVGLSRLSQAHKKFLDRRITVVFYDRLLCRACYLTFAHKTASPSPPFKRSMASDPAQDDWVRIYNMQQKAAEEIEKGKVVRKKQAQVTMRQHLNQQMKVHEARMSKSKEVNVLEGEKERLEYDQWVAEERKAFNERKSKVLEQKAARDVQIMARKERRAEEDALRRKEEAEETMRIKAEIQRAKEEATAKKLAEKERLRKVFEDVAEQQKLKEIEKQKIAQEDIKAAKEYEKMVNAAEEARSSYFIRKVSDNESMAKALDEIFGKRDRERQAKEAATLERIVREEEKRTK